MIKRFGFFLLAFCFFCPVQAAFIEGAEDLPQMDELMQVDDLSMSFDAPEGRILQSYQQSETLTQKQVETFYQETLPALGWTEVKKNVYERDNERLTLTFESQKGLLIVHFELKTNAS